MEIRLNKYLSDAGVCSRREADKLIESGKVFVDGKRDKNYKVEIFSSILYYIFYFLSRII